MQGRWQWPLTVAVGNHADGWRKVSSQPLGLQVEAGTESWTVCPLHGVLWGDNGVDKEGEDGENNGRIGESYCCEPWTDLVEFGWFG